MEQTPLITGQNKKNQYPIFFLILVSLALFMMFCFGSSATCSGFDFTFHYRRLYTLIDALQHGVYPSFYIDFDNVDGYGYFTKGFYSDIILVPFAIVGIFTNVYFAYDFMIFAMTVLCGVLMYHTVNVIFKDSYIASLSSLLYTFSIYRLYDIYQRGALAEALSFTFLPIVFLGIYYIIQGDYKKWYVLAIGYTLLIYTHVISSVLMFVTLLILLGVYYKALYKEPQRLLYLVLAGITTVIMTTYYTLPMLEQMATNSFYLDTRSPGGGAGYGKVGFDLVFWGLLSGIAYPKDELWSGIGIILTVLIFFRFLLKDKSDPKLKFVDIGVILGICFIIATSRIFPWGRFPFNLLSFIQFPWRLYEFVTYFFAIAGAYYLSRIFVKNKQRILVSVIIVVATMITMYIHSENYRYLWGNTSLSVIPVSENGYNLIGREYLPARLPDISHLHQRGQLVEGKNSDTHIVSLRKEYNTTIFNVSVNEQDTLTLPLLYYYGYTATLDGKLLPVSQSELGYVDVVVPHSGEVKAWYDGTTIQKLSIYISLISILSLCVYIIIYQRKRKRDESI